MNKIKLPRREVLGAAFAAAVSGTLPADWRPGEFKIHFIHTGVGECLFFVFPDGTTLMLDCGDHAALTRLENAVPVVPSPARMAGEWAARYVLRVNPNKNRVDYLEASHWHSDHTGSALWQTNARGWNAGVKGANTRQGEGLDVTVVPELKFDAKTCPMCFFQGGVDALSPLGSTKVYRRLRRRPLNRMRFLPIVVLLLIQLAAAAEVGPCDMRFGRVASRRFVLDNELTLCEMNERSAVAFGVQHPLVGRNLRVVGGFWPAAHYRIRVTGPDAAIVFADAAGNEQLRYNAPKDEKPPYDFSVLMTCGHKPATFVTRGGVTRLAAIGELPKDIDVRQKANLTDWKFCVAGCCEGARASLSAGVGQADVRFVTRGRENALYLEDGRVFFTFSARGYGAYQAVASFDPARFDVRLEGVILFDYGDGRLRNDLASHLFYDDGAGEWRAYASNFSTGSDGLGGRAPGGLNAAWSKTCPLRGFRVMRAKSLGLKGMNEDPSATWDAAAKKWRLFVSRFPEKGEKPSCIRAVMLESDAWDGPFTPLAEPVPHDSTGTTIQLMNGRRYCFSGSAERKLFVYSYPNLEELGTLRVDLPPWDETCRNGRVWPCFGELPEGFPYRHLLLTMDRANFPGMPKPNWTYGGLILYASPE